MMVLLKLPTIYCLAYYNPCSLMLMLAVLSVPAMILVLLEQSMTMSQMMLELQSWAEQHLAQKQNLQIVECVLRVRGVLGDLQFVLADAVVVLIEGGVQVQLQDCSHVSILSQFRMQCPLLLCSKNSIRLIYPSKGSSYIYFLAVKFITVLRFYGNLLSIDKCFTIFQQCTSLQSVIIRHQEQQTMASLSKKGAQSTTAEYNLMNNPYFTIDTPASSSRVHNDYGNSKEDTPFLQGSRKSSKAKTELNYSRSGNSNYTASIKQRIEKACSTLSTADLQRENAILAREVEKLEKELLRRDQQIIQMRTQVMPSKEVKAEIIELYRALNYFEGKTKQMENSMSKFRDMILKAPSEGVTAENLNVLFEQLRRDNEQLSAQLQQTEYMKSNVQESLSRLRTKYYESQRELSQFKRRQTSPLQQYYMNTGLPIKSVSNPKINMLFNKMMAKNAPTEMELKEKDVLLRETQSQLEDTQKKVIEMYETMQKLHKQNQTIKYQNEELKGDLDAKDKQITDLFKQCMALKKNLKKHESQFQSESVIAKPPSSSSMLPQTQLSWTPTFKTSLKYTPISHS